MPTSLRRPALSALAALATALAPTALRAQAQDCPVDLYKPSQLAQATVFIQQAANNPEGEAGAKALRDAARLLQDERRFNENPMGLAFAKGQILVLWLHQENPPVEMSERDLNLGRDRNKMINLLQATDSLLTIVETQHPECASEIDKWRQSRPWNTRIGAVYRLLGENKIDSAEFYLKEAEILDRRSPFLYNAQAQIAARRENIPLMLEKLEKAIELAAKDTALAETNIQLKTQYASTLQASAMQEQDAAVRNEKLEKAARMFLSIGEEDPMAQDGPAYYSAAIDIAMLSQNQELLADIIQPMLEDPTPYPDLTLLIAAENSRMLNKPQDAITLYKGALEKNPNIRDANYFLSYLLLEQKKAAEMTPFVDKLMEIDPGNPDNVMMKTMSAREVAEAEKNVQKRRELIKGVEALMKLEAEMPQRVQVTRFERRAEGAVWQGTVENRTRTAKAYTLEVSFLDAEGNAVETMTATTEQAAPGATVTFEVTATQPGIVAWKYVVK